MADEVIKFYEERILRYSDILSGIKRRQKILVYLRLLIFLLAIFLPLAVIQESAPIAIGLFTLLIALFLFFVRRFAQLEKEASYTIALIEINQHEIEINRGNLNSRDEGVAFIDYEHPFVPDLDIFGSGSLFQNIERCCTTMGRDKLALILSNPGVYENEIVERQEAFSELSRKIEFCHDYMATGTVHKSGVNETALLFGFLNSTGRFSASKQLKLVARLFPALTILFLLLLITGVLPAIYFVSMFLIQFGITGVIAKRVNDIHSGVTNRLKTFRKHGSLLSLIENSQFNSAALKEIKNQLEVGGIKPSDEIKKLSAIAETFDLRLNFLAAIFLNGLLLLDLNMVLRLEKWNSRNKNYLQKWLDSIASMDAYISLAIFTFNNREYVFPKPLIEGPVIEAFGLGHPLISPSERVYNNFAINSEGDLVIVTGANMAGKSTFLRSVGVALVLSMAGAPVCAEKFSFKVCKIFSSMRTTDSLSKGESYFYAELKRLKRLFDTLAEGNRVFILLDEILKGTNSEDKQRGSVEIVKMLINLGASGIIATHDLALAKTADEYPDKIRNVCFEVEIDREQIKFDYKLHEGITKNMNALLLMRNMGLISDEPTSNQ